MFGIRMYHKIKIMQNKENKTEYKPIRSDDNTQFRK